MAKAGAGSEPTLDEPAPVLIALRGVSRLYDGGAIAAVRNIDLEIETGDCVAIAVSVSGDIPGRRYQCYSVAAAPSVAGCAPCVLPTIRSRWSGSRCRTEG